MKIVGQSGAPIVPEQKGLKGREMKDSQVAGGMDESQSK